jgi:hypothetical protein
LPSSTVKEQELCKSMSGCAIYCFPCGREHAHYSLKGQVWLIVLPRRKCEREFCGDWWVDHHCPLAVVATRKWPQLCCGVKKREADFVGVPSPKQIGSLTDRCHPHSLQSSSWSHAWCKTRVVQASSRHNGMEEGSENWNFLSSPQDLSRQQRVAWEIHKHQRALWPQTHGPLKCWDYKHITSCLA